MALYDLADRLNWQQACEILGCSKTQLYQLVRAGKIPIYGIGKRYRWFLRADCEELIRGERIILTNSSLKVTLNHNGTGNDDV